MKKLKLIYNPFSGDRTFKNNLDGCIHTFQQAGFETHIFRSILPGDIDEHMSELKPGDYEIIAISGGDGSVNIALNGMMKYGLNDSKLGILPWGTANDFATFLKLAPDNADRVICGGRTISADVGCVNGKYFINVCAAGLLSNVSQIVDDNFKNAFGKLAYYIKGLEQLPNFTALPMRITNSQKTVEQELYWFTILNTAGTGGFDKLSPDARADDGLFDFVGFRAMPLHELAILFVKMLKSGEYLNDERVIFFRDEHIEVEYLGDNAEMLHSDVDGEQGPDMPLVVDTLKNCVEIFVP